MVRINTIMCMFFALLFTPLCSNAQCTLACYAAINVSLDASGNATLTAADILAGIPPTCGTLSVSPNTFNCSDVGSTITVIVSDSPSGNSCFSEITIEDKFSPVVACNSVINASLPSDGTLVLTPSILLASEGDNCPLTYAITPSSLTCSDVGSTTIATITATDPGGNSASCFTSIALQAVPMTMVCQAFINVSLPLSGSLAITPDLILLPPTPPSCALTVSVPSVDCSNVGSSIVVVVSDILSGNSCFSTITVEDKSAPSITCNALSTIQLQSGGTTNINETDILSYEIDNCPLTYTLSPSTISCSDRGDTVPVTVVGTDPGGNTASCIGNLVVLNPRPDSVSIVVPSGIACGSTGINISSLVFGGYGPFNYTWSIVGNPRGWSITSGQGTPSITMDAGIRRVRLKLVVTDICGRKRRKRVRIRCNNLFVGQTTQQEERRSNEFLYDDDENDIDNDDGEIEDIYTDEKDLIFPNPASNNLSWSFPNARISSSSETTYEISSMNGQLMKQGNSVTNTANISDLDIGVYIIKISDGKDVFTHRFVKI